MSEITEKDLAYVRVLIEESIAAHEISKRGLLGDFSWPTDLLFVRGASWAYYVHCAWVGAWNKTDREDDSVTYLRQWATSDDNIRSALRDWHNWFKQREIHPHDIKKYEETIEKMKQYEEKEEGSA
jgi:hypothetical protein